MAPSKLIHTVVGHLLATGVNFISTYLTICFCEQVRLCQAEAHRPKFLSRNDLFFAMALITGFGAKFATNMISYSTVFAEDGDGMNLEVHLRTAPIIGGLFVALVTSWVSLYIGSLDEMFAKTKREIVEMFVEDSKKLTFKQIQSISPMKMLFLLSTKSWKHLLASGIIQGSGEIVLRCLFVHACIVEDSHFEWNIGIVCGAVVVSWLNNILAFWVMFRLTSLYPELEWLRFFSTIIETGGSIIVGEVVAAAVTIKTTYDPTNENVEPIHSNSQDAMYDIAMVSSICFAFILMIIGLCDLRSWLYQTSSHVQKYEMLIVKLKKEHPATVDTITTFIRKHDSLASRHANSEFSEHVPQQSTVVRPAIKYIFTGAFMGRNVVSPQRPSRVSSNIRLQSDVESCRDIGSEVEVAIGARTAERVSFRSSPDGNLKPRRASFVNFVRINKVSADSSVRAVGSFQTVGISERSAEMTVANTAGQSADGFVAHTNSTVDRLDTSSRDSADAEIGSENV